MFPNKRVQGMVGRSTEEAMRIGAQVGYRGMVRELLAGLHAESGFEKAVVCATGGYAEWVFGQGWPEVFMEPDLTLFGLARIFELNEPSTKNRLGSVKGVRNGW